MSTLHDATLDLATALSKRAGRERATRELAQTLQVEIIVFLARDVVLDVFLPAPGMPQTLHGGVTWRALLARFRTPGRYTATVEISSPQPRPAVALVLNDAALVFIGGRVEELDVSRFEPCLRLVGGVLAAEQDAISARAESARLSAELRGEQRRKDEFLAMLGHELRNPLSPLTLSLEIIRRSGAAASMPPRVLDVMTRQLAHLTRLVDDLLDIARVSRGRIELKREPLLLGDVIRQAIEANAQSLQTQRHALDLGEGAAALPLHGDRVRLTQVFSNVINNAAKYSDPEGRIAITTHVEGGDAVVRVSDSGVGIAPDMLARVFDLFAQAPSALGLAKGGLGIGLTLARTLIELHGGRVSAESKGLGKGTTIVIRLPLDAAAGVQPSQSHRLAVARERPPSINVLVVDDNEDAANTTAQLLRESGSNVLVAYTGAAALELAERTDFDLALLDIGLPDMTGYALAEELRRFSGDRTHVLAVSGYGTREAARLANESGFDGYLVKPVSAKALETITRETAERSARREQVEHAAATQR